MNFNTRAFDNIGLMILGAEPIQAMEIEQTMAEVMPAIEHQIFSFENYDQALDHCKEKKNVALIFIEEEESQLLKDKIINLQSIYQASGLPCGVILYHQENPTFSGMRLMRDNKSILAQLKASELLENNKLIHHLKEIWTLYIECVQNHLIDKNAEVMLREVVHQNNRSEILNFKEKICRILGEGLNLTWQESLSLNIHFLIDEVALYDANLLKNFPGAKILSQQVIPPVNESFVNIIKQKEIALSSKLVFIVEDLAIHQMQGKMVEKLNTYTQLNRPGAPALIKQLAMKQESLMASIPNSKKLRIAA